jgi:hypothetical protein
VAKPSRDKTILRITFLSLMEAETYPLARTNRPPVGFAESGAGDAPCRIADPPRRGDYGVVRSPAVAGDHGWPSGVNGVDDLGVVDSLEIDRSDPQVRIMPQLPLDDDQRT